MRWCAAASYLEVARVGPVAHEERAEVDVGRGVAEEEDDKAARAVLAPHAEQVAVEADDVAVRERAAHEHVVLEVAELVAARVVLPPRAEQLHDLAEVRRNVPVDGEEVPHDPKLAPLRPARRHTRPAVCRPDQRAQEAKEGAGRGHTAE